ncbi:MAG: hypothetical protein K1X67_03395 [Fimbriimonadaceae bacterium]|nr:hypothetical protein [Fimbriimonadaceae bacterium]
MIAAIAVLALGQISGDPLLAFLDNRIPVAKSAKALRASLSQWYDVADYAFDDYVFRPDGVKGWVFPLMPGSEMDGGTVALARPAGKTYRLESLMQLDLFMPSSGFLDGGNLVLAGLDGWMGNGPSAEAVVVRKDGGRWKVTQRASSPFQSEECRFERRGNRWIAAIEGRTYPRNLNVSHAMAQVGMRQRFVYSAGVLRAERPYRTMNPMAVLDDLAGAADRGDIGSIRKNCGSSAVARRVLDLGSKLKDSHWDIPGNVCSTSNSIYLSESLRLRFEFKRAGGRWILNGLKPYGR